MARAFRSYQARQEAAETEALAESAAAPETPVKRVAFHEPCENVLRTTGLVNTSPRGVACLHCTHPNAEEQAKILATLLRATCLRNVAMNYLVDGTFAENQELLRWHVDALTENGRQFTSILYLSNGATQRRWRSTPIDAFGVRVSPERFRSRIQNDSALQLEFQGIVRRLVPYIRYAERRGVNVVLSIMLEDNLDREAFLAMLELAQAVLPSDVAVTFSRNVCENCYDGTEPGVPVGVLEEVHTVSPYRVPDGGIVTNDGREYASAVDGDSVGEVSLADLSRLREAADDNGATYLLWSAARQGLPRDLSRGGFRHPDDRDYDVPSFEERREIVHHLRGEDF